MDDIWQKNRCSVIKALERSKGEDLECSLDEESEIITVVTLGWIW